MTEHRESKEEFASRLKTQRSESVRKNHENKDVEPGAGSLRTQFAYFIYYFVDTTSIFEHKTSAKCC